MRFSIVDVFAEAPLQGNQLAVVEDAAALTTERMQDIAREMNFSETTFVLERTNERAKVRIFTPGHELPFAGHPTLGTAWVLGRDQGSYILDLAVGPVQVSFDVSAIEGDEGGGICWMAPPMPEVTGKIDPADAAKYQIMIIFLIASAVALGTTGAVLLSFRRLFNDDHQFLRGRLRNL